MGKFIRVHKDIVEYRVGPIRLFSIASDSLGTQICSNGQFFGPFDFKNVEEAQAWLEGERGRLDSAKRVYWKVWFRMFPLFRRYFWKHVLQKLLGNFVILTDDPDFPSSFLGGSNYVKDVVLFFYGYYKFHKRLSYWDVYATCSSSYNQKHHPRNFSL